jgi:hypothetical protein
MRSFLINKNLSLYYWLRKRIGKREAFWMANTIEKGILILGREKMGNRKGWHMNFTGVIKKGKSILFGFCLREEKIQKKFAENQS